MPYELWRVPLSPEMHTFQAEVGRDQGIVARRNAQHGTVVANTSDNSTRLIPCRPRAHKSPNS